MISTFVRLKVRLLRNVFRTSGDVGLFFFAVGSFTAAVLATAGLWNASLAARVAIAPVGSALLILAWVFGPLLFGASDETIDTTRLALFPLAARPLALGMAASGLVGIGPLAAALPLMSLALRATNPAAVVLGVASAALTLLMATTASRWLLTVLGARLRRRRSRDMATVITGIAVGGFVLGIQVLSRFGPDLTTDDLNRVATVVRWTPVGWVGDALGRTQNGELLVPAVELFATTLLVGFILWRWTFSLERALTDVDDGGLPRDLSGHLVRERSLLARLDPDLATVFAKERRYLARHPRYRVQVVSQATVLLIGGAPFLSAVVARNPVAVLMGCIPGLTAGVTGSNLLGSDARSLWAEILALPGLRPVLRGRSLAFIGMGLSASFLVTMAVATYTGGWRFVPVALGAAIGMSFTGSGVGAFTSTLAPTPFPDDDNPNPFATATPGQGCLNGASTVVGVGIGLLLVLPILAGLAFARHSLMAGLATTLIAPVYGFGLWLVITDKAGKRIDRRGPDLLERLASL